ncbi:MAG: hypothetical protein HYV41_01355 [Candidatus Magasanikbacteria bacterium]|nr:hypothetical protein [Candidatus Magasanikbacteria bacterium]
MGKTITVTYTFKNIGTKTWDSSSKTYLSAYTMEPRYHNSLFKGTNWIEPRQTAKIMGVVKPGQTGMLELQLKAPAKLGHYREKFWLAADSWSWVKGGYFYAEIDVVPLTEIATDVPAPQIEATSTVEVVGDYRAKNFLLSKKQITAVGGEEVDLVVAFQNVGATTWKKYVLVADEPSGLAGISQKLSFADDGWASTRTIFETKKEIPQWGTMREEFEVRAPIKQGNYTLSLRLQADGKIIPDFVIQIPVTVTQDAPAYYVAPELNEKAFETPRLSEEPRIRVGLWKDPDKGKLEFTSTEDSYIVFDGLEQKGILVKNSLGVLSYVNGVYSFTSGELNFDTTQFVRLEPETNPHAVFSLTNYTRSVSWKGPSNFNTYRGALELRLTKSGSLYAINDVLFEDYVVGIAETSNGSPIEYIKALLTAARTYAYYIKEYSTKHDERYFDVVATTGDQLYLGYMSEVMMPRVVQASQETRGYMITYNTDIVITPYFANTDGRTRAWTEVWGGGEKPWLVSVPALYDKRDGKSLYGHGVGMSARDAAYMAEEGKKNWEEILKYYYTGVEVGRVY